MAGLPEGDGSRGQTTGAVLWAGCLLAWLLSITPCEADLPFFKYKDFIRVTLPDFGHEFGKRTRHSWLSPSPPLSSLKAPRKPPVSLPPSL